MLKYILHIDIDNNNLLYIQTSSSRYRTFISKSILIFYTQIVILIDISLPKVEFLEKKNKFIAKTNVKNGFSSFSFFIYLNLQLKANS